MNKTPETMFSPPDHRDFPQGWRWFGKILIFFLKSKNHRSITRKESNRIPHLEAAIQTLREQQIKARERGLVHAERIHNVGLYILLMDRDFSVLKIEMVSTFEMWRLRFTSRQMALLLYEVCDDLTKLLGKDFRDSLAALKINEADMQKFNQICKRLNEFKKANHQFLYHDIRNLVVGHRTQDSIEFLIAIEALDPVKVFKLGGDFFEITRLLIDFITETMLHMAKPQITMKQLIESPKFMALLKSK
jgi:hypothetical protein